MSVLVFYRANIPLSLPAAERYPVIALRKLHDVAAAADAHTLGFYRHIPHSDDPVADINAGNIVNPLVNHSSLRSQPVFHPLLLYMDKRPLPAAEGKMLKPRYQKIFFIFHIICR